MTICGLNQRRVMARGIEELEKALEEAHCDNELQAPGSKEIVLDDDGYWHAMRYVVVMTDVRNQRDVLGKVPALLRCRALHFGINAEPLEEGPLDVQPWLPPQPGLRLCPRHERACAPWCEWRTRYLGWIAAGGCGVSVSPQDWFRSFADQAAHAGIPFFFNNQRSATKRRDGGAHDEKSLVRAGGGPS